MRSCVVVPTYNEAENIEDVLDILLEIENLDVLVVDDSSPDGTADIVQNWVDKSNGKVQLLTREQKNGLGGAYLFGFDYCLNKNYEIICEMDADLSHDPKALPQLIDAVETKQGDLAIGSRYIEGGQVPDWPLWRRALSIGGNIYARTVLGLKVNDATAGFRAYNSDLLRKIVLNPIKADGYGFQIEMTYITSKLGFKIKEVPITFRDRVKGTSKMGMNIVVEAISLVTWWGIRDRTFRRNKYKSWQEDSKAVDTSNASIVKTK